MNDSGTKRWTQYPSTIECRDAAFLYIETSVQKGSIFYFDLGM